MTGSPAAGNRVWTEKDDTELRSFAGLAFPQVIAHYLNRSIDAVRRRSVELGISLDPVNLPFAEAPQPLNQVGPGRDGGSGEEADKVINIVRRWRVRNKVSSV